MSRLIMAAKAKIGILGASGYTGAELVRLLLRHPGVDIVLLTADRRAGKPMSDVFPQFAPYALPMLTALEAADWPALGLDLVFCALPHGTTQNIIKDLRAQRAGDSSSSIFRPISGLPILPPTSAGTAIRMPRLNCKSRRSTD